MPGAAGRDRRVQLLLVERVGVLDAQVGLRVHQVERGVRDVDRAIVGLHATDIAMANAIPVVMAQQRGS